MSFGKKKAHNPNKSYIDIQTHQGIQENYEHRESIKSKNPENTKNRNFENLDIVTLTNSRKCAG